MKSLSNVSLNYEAAFKDFLKATNLAPHMGVLVGDVDGYCLHTNRAFRELLYKNDQIDPRGKNIAELEPESVALERLQIARDVCETGNPVVLRHTRLGQKVESFFHPWNIADPNGPTEHFVCFSQLACLDQPSPDGMEVIESSYNSWGELDCLTKRQLEVLGLLREGYSHKEAAHLLNVSPKTVETHRDQLIRRLGVQSTLAAIRLADRAGLTRESARTKRYSECPWQAA